MERVVVGCAVGAVVVGNDGLAVGLVEREDGVDVVAGVARQGLRHEFEIEDLAGGGADGVVVGIAHTLRAEGDRPVDVGGRHVERVADALALEEGVGDVHRCQRQRLGRGHRGVGAGDLVDGRARVVEGQFDRLALAEERHAGRVEERCADRVGRAHDVVGRVRGARGPRVGRVEAVEVGGVDDVRVDPRPDRPEGVAVSESGEVAELVRADRRRHVDDVLERVRRLVRPAQELADVDVGRPAEVEVAPVELGRLAAEVAAGGHVEVEGGVRPRGRRRLREREVERRVDRAEAGLDRVAGRLRGVVDRAGQEVEVDDLGFVALDQVGGAVALDAVGPAAADQRIVPRVAGDGIGVVGPDDLVEARGIREGQGQQPGADRLRGDRPQVEVDPRGELREVERVVGGGAFPDRVVPLGQRGEDVRVVAAAAHQRVGPRAGVDGVVSGAREDRVVTGPGDEHDRPGFLGGVEHKLSRTEADDDVGEARIGVVHGERVGPVPGHREGSRRQRHGDRTLRIADRIVLDQPVLRAAVDDVVAATAADRVVPRAAEDRVVAGTAVDDVATAAAHDGRVAGAADEGVVAGAAVDDVVAAAAHDGRVAGAADEGVVSGAPP